MIINILHKALLATDKNNKFDWYTPLTFTAQKSNSTIKLTTIGSLNIDGLEYRTNINSGWSTYNIGDTIRLTNVGDFVQFQNTNKELSTSNSNYVNFYMFGNIAASGNIQSMLNYSYSCTPYCYSPMFEGCSSLTTAPELPATNLAEWCYQHMFSGCSNLTVAPELPATTLAPYCYTSMFYNCSNLTDAPNLLATDIDYALCYATMFYCCRSLNYIKVGFTDWNNR